MPRPDGHKPPPSPQRTCSPAWPPRSRVTGAGRYTGQPRCSTGQPGTYTAGSEIHQPPQEMRAMSRLVVLMGRVSGDDDTIAALALVMDLARLADTLEQLRNAQQRLHQAEAARAAADALRLVAGGRQRAVTPPLTPTSTTVPTVGGGRRTSRGR
ncbi:hypothetical protein NKG94_17550 [Micromonospora sp. M12]